MAAVTHGEPDRGARESLDVDVDLRKLLRLPRLDDLRALAEAVRRDGLVTLVAGPERRALLDELQATMALLEGYAEHVMDATGEALLPDLPRLREGLERRRKERSGLLRVFERLIGLDLKLRQYEQGKRFCDAVVAEGGIEALNRAWDGPEALPTLADLDDPSGLARPRRRPRLNTNGVRIRVTGPRGRFTNMCSRG